MHQVNTSNSASRGLGIETQQTPQYNPFLRPRKSRYYIENEPDGTENNAEGVPRFQSPRRILTAALVKGKQKSLPVLSRLQRKKASLVLDEEIAIPPEARFSVSVGVESEPRLSASGEPVVPSSKPQSSGVEGTAVAENVRDTLYPKLHIHWRLLKQRLGMSGNGDLKAAIMDTAVSILKTVPLGVKGQPLLEIPTRPASALVVEYFKGDYHSDCEFPKRYGV